MNKALPLGVFITCINKCFTYTDCSECPSYNKEYLTCKYSNPHTMFEDNHIISLYSVEHAKIDCRKCNIEGKHDKNSACIYNQIKIICRIKRGE